MTVDIPGASTWEPPKPLEKGWYTVRCDKAEKTKTAKNIDSMNLQLTVIDGPEQSDGSDPATDPDRNTLFDFIILDVEAYRDRPKAYRFMYNNLMKALTAFDVLDGDGFEIEDLVGKEVDVYITQGEDNTGEPIAKVSKYKAKE